MGELAGDPTPKVTDVSFNQQMTPFLFTLLLLRLGDQQKGRLAPRTG